MPKQQNVKFVVLAFLGAFSAQQVSDMNLPSNFEESLSNVAQPLLEQLSPYQTHSYTRERGVPQLHDKYGKYLIVFTSS